MSFVTTYSNLARFQRLSLRGPRAILGSLNGTTGLRSKKKKTDEKKVMMNNTVTRVRVWPLLQWSGAHTTPCGLAEPPFGVDFPRGHDQVCESVSVFPIWPMLCMDASPRWVRAASSAWHGWMGWMIPFPFLPSIHLARHPLRNMDPGIQGSKDPKLGPLFPTDKPDARTGQNPQFLSGQRRQ